MRIIGVGTLQRIARQLRNRFLPTALILAYHRIAEMPSDPQLLCISPANFADHLEHLQQHYQIISLTALGQALTAGKMPNKAVIVTFDDGYADIFWNAKPLLERYDIPATLFVTSGYIDQNREFWWDVLERCLLLPESLPDSLTLVIEGNTYSWQINSSKDYTAKWDVTMGFYPTSRHQCYCQLYEMLRPMNNASRQETLNELLRWASCLGDARPDYRALNLNELRRLAESSLIEIGAHTVNHIMLAAQPAGVQLSEINKSKQHLEEMLGIPITSFSYPYGKPDAVNEDTVRLIRDAGFELACANFPAPVTLRSDTLWLPRCLMRNCDGDEFAHRLRSFFYG